MGLRQPCHDKFKRRDCPGGGCTVAFINPARTFDRDIGESLGEAIQLVVVDRCPMPGQQSGRGHKPRSAVEANDRVKPPRRRAQTAVEGRGGEVCVTVAWQQDQRVTRFIVAEGSVGRHTHARRGVDGRAIGAEQLPTINLLSEEGVGSPKRLKRVGKDMVGKPGKQKKRDLARFPVRYFPTLHAFIENCIVVCVKPNTISR